MALSTDSEESLLASGSLFAAPRRPEHIPVMRADPDLAAALTPERARVAERAAIARRVARDPGHWPDASHAGKPGDLGLLVVEGLVSRSVSVGSERSTELLGAGDILRPWAEDSTETIPCDIDYHVLAPLTAARLDHAFVRAIAPWPELTIELVDRALRRARVQSALSATTHVKRVDARLLALFWQLADRWGRVRPDGVLVPIKLKHSTLADLVGAQRPSVTTVLGRMAESGLLTRTPDGSYLLGPTARDELERLCLRLP